MCEIIDFLTLKEIKNAKIFLTILNLLQNKINEIVLLLKI